MQSSHSLRAAAPKPSSGVAEQSQNAAAWRSGRTVGPWGWDLSSGTQHRRAGNRMTPLLCWIRSLAPCSARAKNPTAPIRPCGQRPLSSPSAWPRPLSPAVISYGIPGILQPLMRLHKGCPAWLLQPRVNPSVAVRGEGWGPSTSAVPLRGAEPLRSGEAMAVAWAGPVGSGHLFGWFCPIALGFPSLCPCALHPLGVASCHGAKALRCGDGDGHGEVPQRLR